MNIIEHAILIHASPELVWEIISHLESNSQWQVGCQDVAFISTSQSGAGTRFRHIDERDNQIVTELTAWYDKLGYEYTIVDGVDYGENQGRIRLQEVAEGTIVQWTFTYETGGMLGGLRNAVSLKPKIQTEIVEGLRGLYKVAMAEKGADHEHEVKVLMQDAPTAEERADYQSKHPEQTPEEEQRPVTGSYPRLQTNEIPTAPLWDFEEESKEELLASSTAEESSSTNVFDQIPEPSFNSDDTRPTSTIPKVEVFIPPATSNEQIYDTGQHEVVNKPIAYEEGSSENPYSGIPILPEEAAPDSPYVDQSTQPTSSQPEPTAYEEVHDAIPVLDDRDPYAVQIEDEATYRTQPPPNPYEQPLVEQHTEEPSTTSYDLVEPTPVDSSTSKDTGYVSVFDVFGLDKPSESQVLPKVPVTPEFQEESHHDEIQPTLAPMAENRANPFEETHVDKPAQEAVIESESKFEPDQEPQVEMFNESKVDNPLAETTPESFEQGFVETNTSLQTTNDYQTDANGGDSTASFVETDSLPQIAEDVDQTDTAQFQLGLRRYQRTRRLGIRNRRK